MCRIGGQMAYTLATAMYEQGLECDKAAWVIRKMLPSLCKKVREKVRKEMGIEYDLTKERRTE